MLKSRLVIYRLYLSFALLTLLLVGAVTLIQKISTSTNFKVKAATTINIAALGDSITNTGTFTSLGWLNQYSKDINNQLHTTSQIINLSTNGISSQYLLDQITSDANMRAQIGSAQIVTLEIGYNDFLVNRGNYLNGTCGGTDNQECLRGMVSNFNINWDALVSQIKSLTAANTGNVALRAFDIYYSVAGADQTAAYNYQFSVLNPYLNQMNAHIAESAQQNGFLLGSVHRVFNGASGAEDPIAKGYVSGDAIHPSALGHTLIANRMLALHYFPLEALDTDTDGCADSKELGGNWKLGGQRDPLNRWDFYDTPVPALSSKNWNLPVGDPSRPKMDKVISVNDAQAVWSYFGTSKGGQANANGFSYDTNYGYLLGLTDDPTFTDGMFYDRTLAANQNFFWQTGVPNGAITPQDAQLEFSLYSKGGSDCR